MNYCIFILEDGCLFRDFFLCVYISLVCCCCRFSLTKFLYFIYFLQFFCTVKWCNFCLTRQRIFEKNLNLKWSFIVWEFFKFFIIKKILIFWRKFASDKSCYLKNPALLIIFLLEKSSFLKKFTLSIIFLFVQLSHLKNLSVSVIILS